MSKITIWQDEFPRMPFEGEKYDVDLSRKREVDYGLNGLDCYVAPFCGIPLTLWISIYKDGSIVFHSWDFSSVGSYYLHTYEKPDGFHPYVATKEQIDTVNGLFSGRIKFEGLKLAVGASVQKICPIDVAREEMLIGKKIWFA